MRGKPGQSAVPLVIVASGRGKGPATLLRTGARIVRLLSPRNTWKQLNAWRENALVRNLTIAISAVKACTNKSGYDELIMSLQFSKML